MSLKKGLEIIQGENWWMAGTLYGEAGKGICGLFVQRLVCIHRVLGDRETDLERQENAGCLY